MIGTIEVFPQAHSPDFPLDTLKSFVNSPSSIRVRNVPRKIGKWNITNVFVTIAYPDNTVKTIECVLTGGVYVATFDGCSVSGKVEDGLTISANGKDEKDNVVTGYVLGKGDVEILEARDSINPSKTVYYIHLLEDEPDVPKNGDMYKKDGNYVVYQNGVENQLGISQENMENYVDDSIETVESEIDELNDYVGKLQTSLERVQQSIPTKTSELSNDSDYATNATLNNALDLKQDKLSNAQISVIDSVVNERKTVVTYTNGTTAEFDIEGELTSGSITSIHNAVTVKIGTTVTSIGGYVFSGCTNLTSVTIPDSVTNIESEAFNSCSSLTNVTIPNSVTNIGYGAFYNCKGLTNVTIPDSVTSIGDSAFSRCNSLTSVTIPDSVTSIGDYAFWGCSGLTNVTIPDSVTSIETEAFKNCSGLTNVTIPNSVTNIGSSAFDGCRSLTSVTIPQYVCARRLSDVFSSSYQSITNIVILDGVTSIGDDAFSGCSSLTSITIPNSVTNIGVYAFTGCHGLTSVTIPNSVTNIGHYAFIDCKGLTNVTIPNSVTNIGHGAFEFCSGLTNATFKGKTIEQVQAMQYYPWGITDTSIIKTFNVASKEWVEERLAQLLSN